MLWIPWLANNVSKPGNQLILRDPVIGSLDRPKQGTDHYAMIAPIDKSITGILPNSRLLNFC